MENFELSPDSRYLQKLALKCLVLCEFTLSEKKKKNFEENLHLYANYPHRQEINKNKINEC